MRGLSAAEVLGVWERGRGKRPVQRALELFSAAVPMESPDVLALRSVAERDAALVSLREQTLGPQMQSIVECPRCGEKLELTFAIADIRASRSEHHAEEISLEIGDYKLQLRPPNSLDLDAASEAGENGSDALFQRCLISATKSGSPAEELPGDIVTSAREKMSESDPDTNVQLGVSCATCSHRWTVLFDIVSFFWAEIEACARRLLAEVHALASAYGWTESEILALSATRREFYLEAVRS